MSKYTIAWLPGDGIGKDVMEPPGSSWTASTSTPTTSTATSAGSSGARKVMRSRSAPSISCSKVNAAMFGAITSKPVKAAESRTGPRAQRKGLVYRSPIVRMRQMFDLYICLRPCKAYRRQSAEPQRRDRLVVFRENTEDLYAGVEFNPVPTELCRGAGETLEAVRRRSRTCRSTSTQSPAR